MSRFLDDLGQPIDLTINRDARFHRGVHEMLGMIRGVLADGRICLDECRVMCEWVMANAEFADHWPINVVADRMLRIYADDVVTDEEREDLRLLLQDVIGKKPEEVAATQATDLPLTKPVPEVIFDQNGFVFTGRFYYGTRRECEKEVALRGGYCKDDITLQVQYLVLGSLGSRDWKFSAFGRKIEKAVQYASRGDLAIISEEHWAQYLMAG
jgi:NAD-dependent DNA ligase